MEVFLGLVRDAKKKKVIFGSQRPSDAAIVETWQQLGLPPDDRANMVSMQK